MVNTEIVSWIKQIKERRENNLDKELNFLIYSTPEEDIKVNAVIKDETIWLTQKGMAELFGCTADNISLHLKNIFSEGELDKISVTEKFSATASDGKNYLTQFYNLDAVISVGYRVNSVKATHFRIWATQILKEYMQKGFVLDDERLKQGSSAFGKDYFRELLERVRSIREIPEPSDIKNIKVEEGGVLMLVDIFMPAVRDRINNKFVKKTLSIPFWLNAEAEKCNVNFSGILQEALKNYLHINP